MKLKGKPIVPGTAKAQPIISELPISFLGDIDPETGTIIDKNNPLRGESIVGKILVFPCGKGSTVGSYILYQLAKNKKAPAAIINEEAETIVVVGSIISEIPMLDGIAISKIPQKEILVNADEGFIEF
jgi:hypothetical protein